MESNGKPAGVGRADIGMRLVIDGQSYAHVGKVMDQISEAVAKILRANGDRAEFDFTSFNTHPCKAVALDQRIVYENAEYGAPVPALTQH